MEHETGRLGRYARYALGALAVLVLAALYGGVTSLILHFSGSPRALEIGAIVAGGTVVLSAIVIAFTIFELGSKYEPFSPLSGPRRALVVAFCAASFILILPLVILTLGRAWVWINGAEEE